MNSFIHYVLMGSVQWLSAERAKELDILDWHLLQKYLSSLSDIVMEAEVDANLSDDDCERLVDEIEFYSNKIVELYEGGKDEDKGI